ncbi:Fis family transcriptional regulator [Sulfurimicrobium lacus]|uniref:Putative Fis-like DNA-binding protein n=1 Tax=Sulfurimicrobium lacus TaxID=2715678 RepID=A0A6F8VG31_9PROT|nr:helix-turn-helix domain-containing protein [Sulfurimicrobium lacus]BCB28678.1 Fis family transcriptional regulator [Sulfurimicrobium lacus]
MINENEIATCVRKAMSQYFADLDGETPCAIYDMVVGCVEKPLLEVILNHAQGNQTRAAELLGINRNTLRKKMQTYGIK